MSALLQFLRHRRSSNSPRSRSVCAALFVLSGLIDASTANAGIVIRQYSASITAGNSSAIVRQSPGGNGARLPKPDPAGTTPSLPKPDPADTSPSLPKPDPADTSPSLPKPDPAGTSPSLPKPVPAGTTPSLPKPDPADTSPSLPKPVPAGTSPSLPKPDPAGTTPSLPKPEPTSTAPSLPKPDTDSGATPSSSDPLEVIKADQLVVPVPDAGLVGAESIVAIGNQGDESSKHGKEALSGDTGAETSGSPGNEEAPADNTNSVSSNAAVEADNSGDSEKNSDEATYGDTGAETSGSPGNEEAPADNTNSVSSNAAVEADNSGDSEKNSDEATYGNTGAETSGSPGNEEVPADNTNSVNSNTAVEADNSGDSEKNSDKATYGDTGAGASSNTGLVGDTGSYEEQSDESGSSTPNDAAETCYGEDYDDAKSNSGSGKSDYIGDLFSDNNGSYDVTYSPGTDFTNYPTYDDDPGEDDAYSDPYLSGTTYYGTKLAGGLDLYSELEELKDYGYQSGSYLAGYPTNPTPVPEPSLHLTTALGLLGWGIERIRRRLRKHSIIEKKLK